jgi:hypothetical protein
MRTLPRQGSLLHLPGVCQQWAASHQRTVAETVSRHTMEVYLYLVLVLGLALACRWVIVHIVIIFVDVLPKWIRRVVHNRPGVFSLAHDIVGRGWDAHIGLKRRWSVPRGQNKVRGFLVLFAEP